MIHARCIPTELLLERRSPALSHAERLRVEGHLAECERCRQDHTTMLGVVQLVDERVEASLKANVQERAIARAMLGARDGERAVPGELVALEARGNRWVWGLAGAAAIALFAVGFTRSWRGASAPQAALVQAPAADRVVAGWLSVAGQRLASGAAVPTHRELAPSETLRVSLAHAQLSVTGAQSLSWSPEDRAVMLRGGVADVSVDPTLHQSFRVETPLFSVNVVGTEFRVVPDGVSVTRGRVRVLSPSGERWADLGPGQRWSYTPPARAELTAAEASAAPGEPTAMSPAPNANSATSGLTAAELLARARHRVASGNARGALADLDAVLAARSARSQQAEALTLKGDCALVQGDARGAVRQYLDVSRRFSGSRAAETALFAAARTEADAGDKAQAKRLLASYQQRYPSGQFSGEVAARLRILEGK